MISSTTAQAIINVDENIEEMLNNNILNQLCRQIRMLRDGSTVFQTMFSIMKQYNVAHGRSGHKQHILASKLISLSFMKHGEENDFKNFLIPQIFIQMNENQEHWYVMCIIEITTPF